MSSAIDTPAAHPASRACDATRIDDDRYGVYPLSESDRTALLDHLKALDVNSRRLRFGVPVTDWHLERFVAEFDISGTMGFFRWGELLGVVSIVTYRGTHRGELAISILPGLRGRGWGHELVRCALTSAFMQGLQQVDIQFLSDNAAMRSVTRTLPGERESACGEMTVTVDLDAWMAEQCISLIPASNVH